MVSLGVFQSRLLVKTALKLLIVFVEYSESNSPLLINAVNMVDSMRGTHTHTHTRSLLAIHSED